MANLILAERVARSLSFAVGVGIFLMMLGMWWQRPKQGLPAGTLSPIAAFEFAKDAKEARGILQVVVKHRFTKDTKAARQATVQKLTQMLHFDQFVIVPFYVLLLCLLGLVALRIEASGAFLGAFGLMLLALMTGIFDTLENTYTIVALEQILSGSLKDGLVAQMRLFSVLKWVFLGVSLAGLGVVYLRKASREARQVGVVFLLAGLGVGVGGVVSPIVMRLGLGLMGLALCGAGARMRFLVGRD